MSGPGWTQAHPLGSQALQGLPNQQRTKTRKKTIIITLKTHFHSPDNDPLKQPFPAVTEQKCPLWPPGWNVRYIFKNHNFILKKYYYKTNIIKKNTFFVCQTVWLYISLL